ncbi:hypothetical protein CDL15_Pgr015419 [Punica granatum]|uniref:Uncharacterized protein n=1 Tax=Punica granatum TaxID=22663 RepID=A0A218VZI9_PUNGR|nr:hypothetical protein CDL15_Pgr015419 [Punica granatum]PKI66701.1 hypothetical protein CRG98_012896 [Punica granatum]
MKAVMEALRELGCLEADSINPELHRAIFDALEELLGLPEGTEGRFVNTGRSETLKKYVSKLSELEKMVKRMVLGGCGVGKILRSPSGEGGVFATGLEI